jgi:hypothetical protein
MLCKKLSVVVHACNLTHVEAKGGGSWVQGQPGLHSETLSLKKEKKKKEEEEEEEKVLVNLLKTLKSKALGLLLLLTLPLPLQTDIISTKEFCCAEC